MEINCGECGEVIEGKDREETWNQVVGHMIAIHQLDPQASFDVEKTEDTTEIHFIES